MLQDPQWIPGIAESTKPYIYYVFFSYTYEPLKKLKLLLLFGAIIKSNKGYVNTSPAGPGQLIWSSRWLESDSQAGGIYSKVTLDKAMTLVPGWTGQAYERVRHTPQNNTGFKTYELSIPWIFHVLSSDCGRPRVAGTVKAKPQTRRTTVILKFSFWGKTY